jgi:hypothetical protein
VEAIGDDNDGVDVWIVNKDDSTEAHQCKSRNAHKECWSMTDLQLRNVFEKAAFQLKRNPTCQFHLVSPLTAQGLHDTCERIRRIKDNVDFFIYEELKIRSIKSDFDGFCRGFDLNPDVPDDQRKIFFYLQRLHFSHFQDDAHGHQNLLQRACYLITGDGDSIFATLREYAEQNLRRAMYANELRSYLAKLGLHPKNLSHDARIAPAIEVLQKEFLDSIAQNLIQRKMLGRPETDCLLKDIQEHAVIVVHGNAGVGKSGVLYETALRLNDAKIPFLPIRLDRRRPGHTPSLWGNMLGLPDSPAQCLSDFAGTRPSVLILDQLDALRWTSGHTAAALEVCKQLVDECEFMRKHCGKAITVVLACRSFDLEHDPEIKNWIDDKKHDIEKMDINPLPAEQVKAIVNSVSTTAYDEMTEKQRKILRSPHLLAIWLTISENGALPSFRTTTELLRKFWEDRRKQCNKQGASDSDIEAMVNKIARHMERGNVLSAPMRIAESATNTLDILQSVGVLQTANKTVSFCHQSYFDYWIADRLLIDIHEQNQTIVKWLGGKDRQDLLRREQLKLALGQLNDEAPETFVRELRDLLADTAIRFHLKHLALGVTGQIEAPTPCLLQFLVGLLNDENW